MDAAERLEALEDTISHVEAAIDAISDAEWDDVAALFGVRHELILKTERQRARLREMAEQYEAALRLEHERGLL